MTIETIASMARQVISGKALSRKQALWLVDNVDAGHALPLFHAVSQIRDFFTGTRVSCCSIVAAKVGRCNQNCAFCSQSAHFKTPLQEQSDLGPDEVFRAAMDAADRGAAWFGIVNSGLGPSDAEIDHWGAVIERIAQTGRIGVCASLGVLTADQARRLADFGVQRYNHNLQTSRNFFPRIISTHTYDDRLETLRHVREAGIALCCGTLFGMGETWEDRIDLALDLAELNPEVVTLNFLIPIPGTPLADNPPIPPTECLKMTAIYRFLLPTQEIKIAGGREPNLRDMQSWIFSAGANGFLIGNYLTTCGRDPDADLQMLRDLGLELETPQASACKTANPAGVSIDLR